ncbi:glycosyltransferase family 2 protein [Haloferula sp.]|uniref:glycosyltransferase family 2 protein n=1 Tax=Haloferula sp. TaxID=2497595 RepID=UPI003C723CD2
MDNITAISQQREYDVSIVIPLMNEEDNVSRLCDELRAMMDAQELRYEVLFINDGSTDTTAQKLQDEIGEDERFVVIEFTRNFGQSAAMGAGFSMAQGSVMVPMDGDLQNDPADIPSLVAKLDDDQGYDVICGWRKNRKDKWLSRKLPSMVANRIIRRLTYCRDIHDFGCTLKAYRREVLEDLRLYGEMHRFLPYMCRRRGARMTESVVHHRPRIAGQTKYGLKRTIKVLFDLLTAKFLEDYLTKPLYFFGKLGIVSFVISIAAVAMALVQKFGYLTEHGSAVNLNDNIFILFAMMMFITTVVLFMIGVIAELLIRIYHESQGRMPFKVRSLHRAGMSVPSGR